MIYDIKTAFGINRRRGMVHPWRYLFYQILSRAGVRDTRPFMVRLRNSFTVERKLSESHGW